MFTKNKIFLVNEIKHHVDHMGKFNDDFKFVDSNEQMRIGLMARGDKNGKKDFEYQSIQNARRIIQKFVKNNEICESLVELVEEDGVTGFQLKDILRDNYSFEALRDAIVSR